QLGKNVIGGVWIPIAKISNDSALRPAVFLLTHVPLLDFAVDIVAVGLIDGVQIFFERNQCSRRHKVILPLIGPDYIGAREVTAGEQQWHSCNRRHAVGHTIPEVQSSGMTSPAELKKRLGRRLEVLTIESHDLGLNLSQEPGKQRAGIFVQSRSQ